MYLTAAAVVAAVGIGMPQPAMGFFTGCSASITPNYTVHGMTVSFTVNVTNNAANPMRWIQVAAPGSGNYAYASHSTGGGWSVAETQGGIIATGASINSGQTDVFTLEVTALATSSGNESWIVRASADPSGTNFIPCTGVYSTSILDHLAQDTNNGVSAVSVSNIATTSADVSWLSDNPASSIVYFGETNSYGQVSDYQAAPVTDHFVSLSGLNPETTYHFQVAGSDGVGGYVWSTDGTFVTAANPSTGGGGNGNGSGSGGGSGGNGTNSSNQNQTNGNKTGTTQSNQSGDTVAPSVAVATTLAKSYKIPPQISGTATDNKLVKLVEYSTDNGKNWLPVTTLNGLGSGSVNFSFVPGITADNNYLVLIRATDDSGNNGLSKTLKLVIDKQPPRVNGSSLYVGSQALATGGDTALKTLIGSDITITASSTGGATSIVIDAIPDADKKAAQSFSLTALADSRLWSGVVNFARSGNYSLVARAVDGGGNRVEQKLGSITVEQAGVVRGLSGSSVKAALTIYCRNQDTNSWVVWDGSGYDQPNPITTNPKGEYGLQLPAGTYYLKVSAPDFKDLTTKSFVLTEPTTVTNNFELSPRPEIGIGSFRWQLPWHGIGQTRVDVRTKQISAVVQNMERQLPNFSLPLATNVTDASKKLSTSSLYGKPGVVVVVSTWSSAAQEQLSVLEAFANEAPELNVVAIDSGESWARVAVGAKLAGYKLPIIVDDDGSVTTALRSATLPTTYLIDRSGNIKGVIAGTLSLQELRRAVFAAM